MVSYAKLRKILSERGLTLTKLGKMADVSRATTRCINKDIPMSLVSILLICKALDCKIDDAIDY